MASSMRTQSAHLAHGCAKASLRLSAQGQPQEGGIHCRGAATATALPRPAPHPKLVRKASCEVRPGVSILLH